MTEFQGEVYIAAVDELLKCEGDELVIQKVPIEGPKAFYSMDASESSLWTAGDDCVLKFDGKEWIKFTCPENVK